MTDTDTPGTTTNTPDTRLAVATPGPLLTEGDEPSTMESIAPGTTRMGLGGNRYHVAPLAVPPPLGFKPDLH